MSINDFESLEEPLYEFTSATFTVDGVTESDPDEQIVSKVGSAVKAAMAAKTALADATAEAIDSASTFGYELGVLDTVEKIALMFENSDSACGGWAAAVVRGEVDPGQIDKI